MAQASNPIRDLASQGAFKGSPQHKIAEPGTDRTLPVIDNQEPSGPTISTSVDCYVAGQYLGQNGKTIEVVQRYTVYVQYGRNTQMQTMNQVRDNIVQRFQAKYGQSFNVVNVSVPALPVPKDQPGRTSGDRAAPEEFYAGTNLFKDITRFERRRFDLDTQDSLRDANAKSIRGRYKSK